MSTLRRVLVVVSTLIAASCGADPEPTPDYQQAAEDFCRPVREFMQGPIGTEISYTPSFSDRTGDQSLQCHLSRKPDWRGYVGLAHGGFPADPARDEWFRKGNGYTRTQVGEAVAWSRQSEDRSLTPSRWDLEVSLTNHNSNVLTYWKRDGAPPFTEEQFRTYLELLAGLANDHHAHLPPENLGER